MGAKSTQILEEIYGRLSRHYGPQVGWSGRSPLEILVGTILVQNASWPNVERTLADLKGDGELSVAGLLALAPEELAQKLRPVGYFNRKAERLRSLLLFIQRNYDGDLGRLMAEPSSKLRDALLGVKGIGPETADAILLHALGHPAFVVDTHTYRVFSRHALAAEESGYRELQETGDVWSGDLERNREFHALVVKVGQEFCGPRQDCEACPLKGVNW